MFRGQPAKAAGANRAHLVVCRRVGEFTFDTTLENGEHMMETMNTYRSSNEATSLAAAPPARLGKAALFASLLAVIVAAGCASTKVTKREQLVNEPLPRPRTIWIYNFAATPADLPPDSPLAREPNLDATPQTAEQIDAGRQLGSDMAAQLADQIRQMGMFAAKAMPDTKPQVNDLVIRGYLLSVKEGSAAKRVAIGFGAGASALCTMVEGYQITPEGERKLGSGTVDAGGNKTPGAALGVAGFLATANPAGLIVSSGTKLYGEASGSSKLEGRAKATAKEIAGVLKQRFQQQGWID